MAVIKVEKMFDEMRNAALSSNPREIGIKNLPEKEIAVFGMVMEMGYEGGAATVVAYQTGDASVYYSEGGGFMNGASHPEINKAAKDFVYFAQGYVKHAAATASSELPGPNTVNFYFLTNKGKFLARESIEKLGTDVSPWTPLFKEGNRLITEINVHSEVKIKHKYLAGEKK